VRLLNERKVVEILESLVTEGIKHRPTPSYGKIGTIKAMVDLGKGWHNYRRVQKELGKYLQTGNVYTFQLAKLYPSLLEVDDKGHVRVKPDAFPLVAKHIQQCAKKVLNEINKVKKAKQS
jgi:hypothetical protein